MFSRDTYVLESEGLLALLCERGWTTSPNERPDAACIARLARKKDEYEANGDFSGSIKRILNGTGVEYRTAALFMRSVLAGRRGAPGDVETHDVRDWIEKLSGHTRSRAGRPPVKRAMDSVAALGGRMWERVLAPPPEAAQGGTVLRAIDDAILELDAARDRKTVRDAAKGLAARIEKALKAYESIARAPRWDMAAEEARGGGVDAATAKQLEVWSWQAEADAEHADAVGCRAVASTARELAGWCRYHSEVAAAIPELQRELERLEAGLRERREWYGDTMRMLGGSECWRRAGREFVYILGRVRRASGEAARRVGWEVKDEDATSVVRARDGVGGRAGDVRNVVDDVREALSRLCERV